MSGGSYNYLCWKDTILGHSDSLRHMAKDCRQWAKRPLDDEYSHEENASRPVTAEERASLVEIAEYLDAKAEWMEQIEVRAQAAHIHMQPLLKAVEWTSSGDWGPMSVIEAIREMEKSP